MSPTAFRLRWVRGSDRGIGKERHMKVLIIGATGGTGAHLLRALVAAGHEVRAMVRREDQIDDVVRAGATAVVADLEGDLDEAVAGVEAVCFCAGSGSSTGPDKTLLVDLHGAVRTIDACRHHGVDRYVMLSSIAAGEPERGRETIRHYLAAKHAADRILMDSDLDWTVVRPGGLTDDEPTGRVEVGVPRLPERGQIPRADVAAVMAACLDDPRTHGAVFELISGDVPVEEIAEHL
jgi:uncharacterized protein YbjT (DUF2867 family)